MYIVTWRKSFNFNLCTAMRRLTTFLSTTDYVEEGGPIISQYYKTYHCVTFAYGIQYSKMLYTLVA